MKHLILIISIIPICIGAIIYIVFRSDNFLVSNILESMIGTNEITNITEQIRLNINLSYSNINSLPSALWVFSTSFLSSRSKFNSRITWYIWITIPLIYSLGLEGLQLLQVTDGTYDPLDVKYSIIGWVCAMLVAKVIDISTSGCSIPYYYLCLFYGILIFGNVW